MPYVCRRVASVFMAAARVRVSTLAARSPIGDASRESPGQCRSPCAAAPLAAPRSRRLGHRAQAETARHRDDGGGDGAVVGGRKGNKKRRRKRKKKEGKEGRKIFFL